jgi:ribosomal protein L17
MIKGHLLLFGSLFVGFSTLLGQIKGVRVCGYVYEAGEKTLPATNVKVIVEGFSNAFTTSETGYFDLFLPSKEPGDVVVFSVIKKGYVPVSPDMLKEFVLKKNQGCLYKIYLERTEKRQATVNNLTATMNAILSSQKRIETQIAANAESYAKGLKDVAEKLLSADTSNTSMGYRKAVALVQEGKIAEAYQAIKENTITPGVKSPDSLVKLAKKEYRYKAQLAIANAKFEEAHVLFKKLLLLDSTDEKSLLEYADFLWTTNKPKEAEWYYLKTLKLYQQLMVESHGREAEYARLLNNFGNLKLFTNDLLHAELYYKEALQFRRELYNNNPTLHTDDYARTLNNLGNLYLKLNEYSKAKPLYQEALGLFESLIAQNPQQSDYMISVVLMNLGLIAENSGEVAEAIIYYQKAEKIANKQEADNSLLYKSQLAKVFNNLGGLFKEAENYDQSEQYHRKALAIRKELALQHPDLFERVVAESLHNIALVLMETDKKVLANEYFVQTLSIFRRLEKKVPGIYDMHIAKVIGNYAILWQKLHEFEKAEASFTECLNIWRALAAKNPKAYQFEAVRTISNMGVLYQLMIENGHGSGIREKALQLMDEAQNRIGQIPIEHNERNKFKDNIIGLTAFFRNK